MPSREKHLAFDEILRLNGVICEDTCGDSVHARLDRGAQKYAEAHRELDFYHSHSGIRDYVDQIVNSIGNIYKETATDYVRIAHGHLCLDYMASKLKYFYDCSYDELNWDFVYKRTWAYFRRNGLHKTYYKRSLR